ncbi:phage holin family protein [Intrasporangium chromatireducens]|nr:phage holin family protein [Intrasporangium chromatireducens]
MTGAAPGGAPAGHTGAYAGAPDGTRTGDDLPGEPLSSVGDLISDIAQDLSTLVRQETELAKAELRQSATRAGKGAGMLGGAGVAGYFVLLFLSVALWWLIGSWVGLGWSALIVAVVWAIIAAVLASMGRTELKRVQGVPRTVETAKQIPDAMKGNEDPR